MHVSVIGNTGVGKSALCNYLSGKSYQCMSMSSLKGPFRVSASRVESEKDQRKKRETSNKIIAFPSN